MRMYRGIELKWDNVVICSKILKLESKILELEIKIHQSAGIQGLSMADETFEFDVFLSHNSKDKPAVEQLARLLRDEYQIRSWLDKWNLVPGDPWQMAIEDALDHCQTFAVFIGPSGVGSWESPEMQVALDIRVRDRNRRVVPVLLPGAPDNSSLKLPSFLRMLTWVDFRGGLDDRITLHRFYCGIRGIAPGDDGKPLQVNFQPVVRKIPPTVKNFLPYLADCTDQEYCLQEALGNNGWQAPIVAVVHGDEYQCLEKFRERLEKVSLPRLMKLNEEQEVIKSYSINWPATISDIKDFPKRLLNSLSTSILRQGLGTRDVIQQELASHPVPVLIHATLLSSEWKSFKEAWIDQYLVFWKNWPQLAPRQKLLVFLFIKYESKYSKGSLFSTPLNKQIEAQVNSLDFSQYSPLRGIVLPKLNGVSRAEAEDWARSDEVRALCDSDLVIREIREWYSRESKEEKQLVPMEKLVDSLKKFLEANKISQESAG
jgi:hypothetical protein